MPRTTINIDDDVLRDAKQLARESGCSLGRIISSLARRGISKRVEPSEMKPRKVFGFRPFAREGRLVPNQLINRLRESGEY